MKFTKTTRYGTAWYEIESPDVRGYPWFLRIMRGGYQVEYAGASEEAKDETFEHAPSSPDEQSLVDQAPLIKVISWAHKDILERIAEKEPLIPLAEVGQALYGQQWQNSLARDLMISDRTIRRWASNPSSIALGVGNDLLKIVEGRMEKLSSLANTLKSQISLTSVPSDLDFDGFWSLMNDRGMGEAVGEPHWGINELDDDLDASLVVESPNDTRVSVYRRADGRFVIVGNANGPWAIEATEDEIRKALTD